MNPRSTAQAKQFMHKLASSSRFALQELCYSVLKSIYPELIYAPEMGEIGAAGIDLYTVDLEWQHIDQAFQCKGFENLEFGQSQLQQCIISCQKLLSSGVKLSSYYLIINRMVKERAHRK